MNPSTDIRYCSFVSVCVPIRNTADYSPFGVQLDGRTIQGDFYRYGFQNQEEDSETGLVNYKYRMHDPRVGRFFAIDPLASKYPYYSTYSFSGNRVIDAVELEGLEPAEPQPKWTYTISGLLLGGVNYGAVQFFDADFVENWINGTYGENMGVSLINGVSIAIGGAIGGAIGNLPGFFIGAGVGLGVSILTQKIIGISVNFIANNRIKRNKEEWNCLNEELEENNTIISKNKEVINNTLKDMKGTINENIETEENKLKSYKKSYEWYKKADEGSGGDDFWKDPLSEYSKKIIDVETKITNLKNLSDLENQNVFLTTRNKQISEIKNSIVKDKNYESKKK